MPRSRFNVRAARAGALALVIGAGLALPGCLEEDEVSPALAEASAILESLGAPGNSVPGDAFREGEYQQAISILRPVMGEGSEAQNAAAALMIARAEVGLAQSKLLAVDEAHRKMYNLLSSLRAEYAEWSTLSSLAETAEAYDPAEEQARLNEQIQERDAQIAEAQQAKEQVEQQVADLEARAEEAGEQAAALRQQELEQRDQTATLNAREALPFHMEAGRLRREADGYEVTMEQRLSEADMIRPQIAERELEIERLTSQRDDLVTSSQEVAGIAVKGRDEARQLREQSSETASRIDTLLGELEALRTGELENAMSEARSALESAASSAGRARSGDRNGASLATGEIQQSLGALLAGHAAALESASAIMDQMVSARTALPSQSRVQSAADSYRSAAETTRQEAVDALIAARDAFESASIRGAGADSIDNAVSELSSSIESLGGPSAEPEMVPGDEMTEDDFAQDEAMESMDEESDPDLEDEAIEDDAGDPA